MNILHHQVIICLKLLEDQDQNNKSLYGLLGQGIYFNGLIYYLFNYIFVFEYINNK